MTPRTRRGPEVATPGARRTVLDVHPAMTRADAERLTTEDVPPGPEVRLRAAQFDALWCAGYCELTGTAPDFSRPWSEQLAVVS